jgi:signal transduction histidine kinase
MIARHRFTIRGRLTLWYAAVFVTTGAVLLTVVYLLARRELFTADAELVRTLDTAVTDSLTGGEPSAPAVRVTPDYATAIDEYRRESLQTIMIQSAVVFILTAMIALVLCWLVAGRALRPLRTITGVAAGLSHDTLDSRITHTGPADELKTLTDTFNTMLDRLARAFQAQYLFAANASHELRTPLTVIQTAAEKALWRPNRPESEYRTALTTVVAAAHRSERLLSSLLMLAQRQQHIRREDINFGAVIQAAVAAWPDTGPKLQARLSPAPLRGDPVLLELLVRNLLDNAVCYNTDSGTVWIHTTSRNDEAILEVENTGPPIAAADLPTLRQPFQRGTRRTGSPDGFGLGLAIVDAIVTAHQGHWEVKPRATGGLSVTVTLPTDAGAGRPRSADAARPG